MAQFTSRTDTIQTVEGVVHGTMGESPNDPLVATAIEPGCARGMCAAAPLRAARATVGLTCLLVATATLLGCDEGGPSCGTTPLAPACSEAPAIDYPDAAYSAQFFSSGSSAAPTIAWNGEVGTLSVASPVTGVTLDTSTGVASWSPSLPLGVSTVHILATNSAGADTATLEIENRFQGHFEGGYSANPGSRTQDFEFAMTFSEDGTLTVLDNGSSEGEGTWTLDGTRVTAVYSYNGGGSFLTVQGVVAHETSGAALDGFWYDGDRAVEGAERGYVAVALVSPGT